MSNSLRDQLLKAGLATQEQARKAAHEERRRRKNKRRKGASAEGEAPSETEQARRLAQEAAAAQRERDRALNAEQRAAQERKALKARIRDLLEKHSQKTGHGDVRFNFTHDSRIKHIYVDAKQQAQLAKGKLAIAYYGRRYHVLSLEAADKLAALDPEIFISRVETSGTGDDAYADHPIPDDLMW